MDAAEQAQFAEYIAEAQKLFERSQAVLQRAKARCHGEIYEHVDVIAKRAYELKVRAEWLRLAVLGEIDPAAESAHSARALPDRRNSIDRRVAGMRKQILALKATEES